MAERVTVYGADWCGDTHRTLRQLRAAGVDFDYVDIDENRDAEKKVIEFNRGKRRIPMVEIGSDDGEPRRLSVPNANELEKALK